MTGQKQPQTIMCKNNADAPNRQFKAPHLVRRDSKPDMRYKSSHLPPQQRIAIFTARGHPVEPTE